MSKHNRHSQKHNAHSQSECNLDPTEIARRAYELYLERGGDPGHELDDWVRAECELKERDQQQGQE
ncbi:MAG: DUF2934 domain-containing protein [Limisphaerales bacterium]